MRSCAVLLVSLLLVPSAARAQKPRERDLNLPIGGTAGPLDEITDVAGVEVGQTTLVSGSGKLVVGQGPVPSRQHAGIAEQPGRISRETGGQFLGLLFGDPSRTHRRLRRGTAAIAAA